MPIAVPFALHVKARALAGVMLLALIACARNEQHRAAPNDGPRQAVAGTAAAVIPSALDEEVDLRATAIEVQRGSLGHLMPMDSPQNDIDTFVFTGRNRSAKAMSSFSATATLQDQRGATLYRGLLEVTDVVPPSGSFLLRVTVTNDDRLPNPELVRAASLAQTHLTYRVRAIAYADGTKAIAPP